jgi:hypothetical protein
MATDGLDLAAPPVRVWQAMARHVLFERNRGVSSYSMAAGGFNGVMAMPRNLGPQFRQPANANSMMNAQLTELYHAQPGLMKKNLIRQFNPSRVSANPKASNG